MSVNLVIEQAEEVGSGIWEATIDPQELELLGAPQGRFRGRSIVLLEEAHIAGDCLTFLPSAAHRLNAGTERLALFVLATPVADSPSSEAQEDVASGAQIGDRNFLDATPPELRPLAEPVLREIRRRDPQGYLNLEGQRHVNRPDNWVTLKPQPYAKSLAVTVRGRPDAFGSPASFLVKPDRGSYARFTIDRDSQLPEALEIIRTARMK